MTNINIYIGVKLIILLFCFLVTGPKEQLPCPKKILEQCLETGNKWDKIYAAESLVRLGLEKQNVEKQLLKELAKTTKHSGLYIGCLRTLYLNEKKNSQKSLQFINEIKAIAFCPKSSGQIHGLETLAKLNIKLTPNEKQKLSEFLKSKNELLAGYSTWLKAAQGDQMNIKKLSEMLNSKKRVKQYIAAYAAYYLSKIPKDYWLLLKEVAEHSEDQLLKLFALRALIKNERNKKYVFLLPALSQKTHAKTLQYYLLTIAELQNKKFENTFVEYFRHNSNKVKIAAAFGFLFIEKNTQKILVK